MQLSSPVKSYASTGRIMCGALGRRKDQKWQGNFGDRIQASHVIWISEVLSFLATFCSSIIFLFDSSIV